MLTYGFFNSLNNDRKYNAEQMAYIIDALVNDGVMQNYGEYLAVKPGDGMSVVVEKGMAWFDSTWTRNDGQIVLDIDPADVTLARYDAVVLEVDRSVAVRANSIKVVKGAASSAPAKPTMVKSSNINQYPLAYVKVEPSVTSISSSSIEIRVGQSDCPWITGILQTVPIDTLFAKWDGEFSTWFENLQSMLDDNVVTNLQSQIDELDTKVEEKADKSEVGKIKNSSGMLKPYNVEIPVLPYKSKLLDGIDIGRSSDFTYIDCSDYKTYIKMTGENAATVINIDASNNININNITLSGKYKRKLSFANSTYLVFASSTDDSSNVVIDVFNRLTLNKTSSHTVAISQADPVASQLPRYYNSKNGSSEIIIYVPQYANSTNFIREIKVNPTVSNSFVTSTYSISSGVSTISSLFYLCTANGNKYLMGLYDYSPYQYGRLYRLNSDGTCSYKNNGIYTSDASRMIKSLSYINGNKFLFEGDNTYGTSSTIQNLWIGTINTTTTNENWFSQAAINASAMTVSEKSDSYIFQCITDDTIYFIENRSQSVFKIPSNLNNNVVTTLAATSSCVLSGGKPTFVKESLYGSVYRFILPDPISVSLLYSDLGFYVSTVGYSAALSIATIDKDNFINIGSINDQEIIKNMGEVVAL